MHGSKEFIKANTKIYTDYIYRDSSRIKLTEVKRMSQTVIKLAKEDKNLHTASNYNDRGSFYLNNIHLMCHTNMADDSCLQENNSLVAYELKIEKKPYEIEVCV